MKQSSVLLGAVGLCCSTMAFAQSSASDSMWGASLGVRAFSNRISGPGYFATGVPGTSPFEAGVASTTTTSYLPSFSLRYGQMGVYGSYHAGTTYKASVLGGDFQVFRKEWDASVGYSVLPNVVAALGWKSIRFPARQIGNPGLPQAFEGPFVGASVGVPLVGAWSVFGSLAIGRPKFELSGIRTGSGGNYLASELGLRFSLGQLWPSLQNASLLFGYRAQSFQFNDVPFSFLAPLPDGSFSLQGNKRSIRSGIEGITAGVSYSF